jgi:hypothetical protein
LWTNTEEQAELARQDKFLESPLSKSDALFSSSVSSTVDKQKKAKRELGKTAKSNSPSSYEEPTVKYKVAFDFSECSSNVSEQPKLILLKTAKDVAVVESDSNMIVVACTGHIDTVLKLSKSQHIALDYKTTDSIALAKYRDLRDSGKLGILGETSSYTAANKFSTFPYHNNILQLSCYGSILLSMYGNQSKNPLAIENLDLALVYMSRSNIEDFEVVPVSFGMVDQRRALEMLHRNMLQVAIAEMTYQNFIAYCDKISGKMEGKSGRVATLVEKFFNLTNSKTASFNISSLPSAAVLYHHKLCQSESDHNQFYNPGKKPWSQCPLTSICLGVNGLKSSNIEAMGNYLADKSSLVIEI